MLFRKGNKKKTLAGGGPGESVLTPADVAPQAMGFPEETDHVWAVKKKGKWSKRYNKSRTLVIKANIVTMKKGEKNKMEVDLSTCVTPFFNDKDCKVTIKGNKTCQFQMERKQYQELKAFVEMISKQGNTPYAPVKGKEPTPATTVRHLESNIQDVAEQEMSQLVEAESTEKKLLTFQRLTDDNAYLESNIEFTLVLAEDIISRELFWEIAPIEDIYKQSRQLSIKYIQDEKVVKPEDVAFKPDEKVVKPEDNAAESDAIFMKPEVVAFEPEEKAVKNEDVASEPDEKAVKPENVAFKPDEKAMKPEDVAFISDEKVVKPEDVAFKPDEKAVKLENNAAESDAIFVKPEVVAFEPEEKAMKPEVVASESDEIVMKNEDVASEPDEKAVKPGAVAFEPDEKVVKPESVSTKSEDIAMGPRENATEPYDNAIKRVEKSVVNEDLAVTATISKKEKRGLKGFPKVQAKLRTFKGMIFNKTNGKYKSLGKETSLIKKESIEVSKIPDVKLQRGNSTGSGEDETPQKNEEDLIDEATTGGGETDPKGELILVGVGGDPTEELTSAGCEGDLKELILGDGGIRTEESTSVEDRRELAEVSTVTHNTICKSDSRHSVTKKPKSFKKTITSAKKIVIEGICAVRDSCKKTLKKAVEIWKKITVNSAKHTFENSSETEVKCFEVEADVPTEVWKDKRPIEAPSSSIISCRNGKEYPMLKKAIFATTLCFWIKPVSGYNFTAESSNNDWYIYLCVPAVIGYVILWLGENHARLVLEFLTEQLGRFFINGGRRAPWVEVQHDGIHLAAQIEVLELQHDGIHLAAQIVVLEPPIERFILPIEEEQAPTADNEELVIRN
ncbi:uncharacterized protein LOC110465418 isoform X2 [Mizuhopecten yessoensis]|uniref:uncharacterized protein LOC110465418 isoform X2 n=1 Tax=Mizuhopecten yessoensis TaxID=6573 RepID=UPI000B45766D|nr:uncharacterized protein LOC110465418 isoform X2 [Mizuhopecten yessoensis]